MNDSFLSRVAETIEQYDMAQPGERIMCCLSGGADSVALLLSLRELGYDVFACHINHLLRGAESERDEAFCRDLCTRLGVEIFVHRENAAAYSQNLGVSVEEGARRLRYSVFEKCANGAKTATAHTLSDNLETVLFHLARGTGLDGLVGIPPKRDNVIRPMINCRREEVEDFLNSIPQQWVTDSTNLSQDYSRNKIRHSAVPALEAINPSLEKTFAGTLENLREDAKLLKTLSDELFEKAETESGRLDAKMIYRAQSALSLRAIKRLTEQSGAQYNRYTLKRIRELCESGGRLTLGNGRYASVKNGLLYIESGPVKPLRIEADIGGQYVFFEKKVRLFTKAMEKKYSSCADLDKINGRIVIRSRVGADRIKFIGKAHSVSLKKLFQSELASEDRLKAVVLSDDDGPFFAEGHGFSERVKADSGTKTVLICKIS